MIVPTSYPTMARELNLTASHLPQKRQKVSDDSDEVLDAGHAQATVSCCRQRLLYQTGGVSCARHACLATLRACRAAGCACTPHTSRHITSLLTTPPVTSDDVSIERCATPTGSAHVTGCPPAGPRHCRLRYRERRAVTVRGGTIRVTTTTLTRTSGDIHADAHVALSGSRGAALISCSLQCAIMGTTPPCSKLAVRLCAGLSQSRDGLPTSAMTRTNKTV